MRASTFELRKHAAIADRSFPSSREEARGYGWGTRRQAGSDAGARVPGSGRPVETVQVKLLDASDEGRRIEGADSRRCVICCPVGKGKQVDSEALGQVHHADGHPSLLAAAASGGTESAPTAIDPGCSAVAAAGRQRQAPGAVTKRGRPITGGVTRSVSLQP